MMDEYSNEMIHDVLKYSPARARTTTSRIFIIDTIVHFENCRRK